MNLPATVGGPKWEGIDNNLNYYLQKIYQQLKFIHLVSIMKLNYHAKNGVKNLSYSRNILCKIIKQYNWWRELGFECQNPKNQTFKLLEITESTCCFYGCLSICKKKNNIAEFSLDILQIYLWKLLLTCLGMPDHSHIKGVIYKI